MPLEIATTSGTMAQPDPMPSNNGGTINTQHASGTAQVDILRALQTGVDMTQEVNSFIARLCQHSVPARDARTMLYALKDVVNRMVTTNDDLTAVRNYTP